MVLKWCECVCVYVWTEWIWNMHYIRIYIYISTYQFIPYYASVYTHLHTNTHLHAHTHTSSNHFEGSEPTGLKVNTLPLFPLMLTFYRKYVCVCGGVVIMSRFFFFPRTLNRNTLVVWPCKLWLSTTCNSNMLIRNSGLQQECNSNMLVRNWSAARSLVSMSQEVFNELAYFSWLL